MSEILVIEDSPTIALLLRRRLEMAGHSVKVAATSDEALAGFDETSPPDIVLADHSIPGASGLETLKRIKSRAPGIPGILVTAWSLTPEERTGADDLVTKPIDFNHLLATIARLTR